MKCKKVVKRDGTEQLFYPDKIKTAILKAMHSVDNVNEELAEKIMDEIGNSAVSLSVEAIQDKVEKKLMASNCKDVAQAYIRYRYKHELARNDYDNLMSALETKLKAAEVTHQNASVDEISFGGRIGEAANLIMKRYALEYGVSDMAKYNHEHNLIYIHDLDHYAVGNHNCLSIPFDKLLLNGFKVKQTDIRPAQSVSTAFQLLAVIFQLQSLQQFGRRNTAC